MLEFVWKTDDCCCKSWERDLQSGRDHEGSLKMIRQYVMSSVQFSHSVVSYSLQPHGLQYPRLPCPLPTPRAYSNLCPKSLVMPSNHLILCCPLLLLPSIFLSIRVFSNESVLRIRWPKYWSFSFSISPSNEYSGLISLRKISLISMQPKGLSRVFSNITFQKHQFFGIQLSL